MMSEAQIVFTVLSMLACGVIGIGIGWKRAWMVANSKISYLESCERGLKHSLKMTQKGLKDQSKQSDALVDAAIRRTRRTMISEFEAFLIINTRRKTLRLQEGYNEDDMIRGIKEIFHEG